MDNHPNKYSFFQGFDGLTEDLALDNHPNDPPAVHRASSPKLPIWADSCIPDKCCEGVRALLSSKDPPAIVSKLWFKLCAGTQTPFADR